MSFVNKVPDEVFDYFKKKRSCFFVGAGLSIPAGFPNWYGLIDILIAVLEKRGTVSAKHLDEYKKVKGDPTKVLLLAEELKAEIGNEYYDLMEERFGQPDVKPTKNHELIVSIPSNLTITINYDRLIENAFNKAHGYTPNFYTYKQSREAANSFWKEKYFVFKAHGDANSDPQGLILSQKDYRRTLYREMGYRSLLQTIFTTFSVVFVGVSLNDPEYNQLLDYIHESYHGGGPTHYALLEESKTPTIISKRYLEEFKVQTIVYDNNKGDHHEITDFLQEVVKSVK